MANGSRHTLVLSFPFSSAMGGGERYIEQIVEGLSAGRAFTLVSSSRALLNVFRRRSWDNRPLWGGVEPVSKFSVIIFPFTIPFFLPLLIATLCMFRFTRGTRDVICLSLTEKLLATVPARLLGMRVIWMEHLVPGRSLLLNPYRRAFAWLSRFTIVIAVSKAVIEGLVSLGVSRSRVQLIAPGVLASTVKCQVSGAPIVGVVSRLSKEKNVGFLIRAFADVVREIPEARLEVFGDGPERAELEHLAESLGIGAQVGFHGFVDGHERLYGNLRLLAVPSHTESFGIAALEAMSCGIPIVAANVGGLPELVNDRETGRLVPPDDEKAWTEALLETLRDPELIRVWGEAGRARAANMFPLSKMMAAWKSLLDAHG